jgi:hypothetical protein
MNRGHRSLLGYLALSLSASLPFLSKCVGSEGYTPVQPAPASDPAPLAAGNIGLTAINSLCEGIDSGQLPSTAPQF